MNPASGAPSGPLVQVFGTPDSQATRAALRFFKERRLEVHFVDIHRKPIAPGELRRFVERLGARTLADTEGKAWRDAGLAYLSMPDADLADRLLRDQRLLKLPLVRVDNGYAAGRDEASWKSLMQTGSRG
ncbi:MAG: arsenate reductase [Chloroflexi bacterium]|nr:arsenate reductase [Chloroflexota bacterium]